MKTIRLAFSPCPNDTFIFDAIINKRIDTEGIRFDYSMHDVETLNFLATRGEADMIKVSYHAYLYLLQSFVLLDSGSAMGMGNGPLLISRETHTPDELKNLRVAIPGELTTGHLMLKFYCPEPREKRFMVFSAIENSILAGETDAGVIIHENRFTYESRGLKKMADLGQLWEAETGMPIPLGGIIARKALGYEGISRLNRILHRSVRFALDHPDIPMPFVRECAQAMDETVMKKHIELYVNDYTLSMGSGGRAVLTLLMDKARQKGIIR